MSDVKRVQFESTIHAPPSRVWDTMLGPETYRRWTKVFHEGSYFVGDWIEGSRMQFLIPSGDGMVSEIAAARRNEHLSIRHLGVVADGVEDTESDSVRAWAPVYENYTLTPVEGGTRVTVDQDLSGDYEESMRNTWTKALDLLKELCEETG